LPQTIAFPRSHELDVLVLENVDALADHVLQELCEPVLVDDEHRPALVLLAKDAILDRLREEALAPVDAAISARLSLQHLAPSETAPFIHYQMSAAHLDHLDIFKAPLVELIGIYADGNPTAVNDLAHRILTITQRPRSASAPTDAVEPAPEQEPIASIDPRADPVAPPLDDARASPNESDAATARPNSTAESDAAEKTAALAQELPRAGTTTPLETEQESPAVAAEPVPAAEAPMANDSDIEAAEQIGTNAITAATPNEQKPGSGWTVELPPSFDSIEATLLSRTTIEAPLSEEPDGGPDAASDLEAAPQAAEGVSAAIATHTADDGAPPSEDENLASPAAESAALLIDESAVPPADDGMRSTEQPASETNESDAQVQERAAPQVVREDPWPLRIEEPEASIPEETMPASARRLQGPRRLIAMGVVVVLAAIALVVGFNLGHLGITDAARTDARFAALVDFVTTLRHRLEAVLPRHETTTAQVPVAIDPAAPPLRTQDTNPALRLRSDTGGTSSESPPKPKEPTAAPPSSATPPTASPPTPIDEGKAVIQPLPPEPPPAPPAATTPPAPMPAPESPATSPTSATKTTAPLKRETAPAPAPIASPQPNPTAPADAGQLLSRGDQLLASGDIIAARQYFGLAAEAGDPHAALRLGKTYDPTFLKQIGARGIAGDPATAKSWYLKSIASGDKDADLRLLQLMALYPE
jgi:hypothetical protein